MSGPNQPSEGGDIAGNNFDIAEALEDVFATEEEQEGMNDFIQNLLAHTENLSGMSDLAKITAILRDDPGEYIETGEVPPGSSFLSGINKEALTFVARAMYCYMLQIQSMISVLTLSVQPAPLTFKESAILKNPIIVDRWGQNTEDDGEVSYTRIAGCSIESTNAYPTGTEAILMSRWEFDEPTGRPETVFELYIGDKKFDAAGNIEYLDEPIEIPTQYATHESSAIIIPSHMIPSSHTHRQRS